jgi:hypothetical protein
MPKRSSKKKKPDLNELAASIVEQSTSDSRPSENSNHFTETMQAQGKNPAAVALGRLGGLKGGYARRDKLSAQQRKQIAKKAAKARWKKD